MPGEDVACPKAAADERSRQHSARDAFRRANAHVIITDLTICDLAGDIKLDEVRVTAGWGHCYGVCWRSGARQRWCMSSRGLRSVRWARAAPMRPLTVSTCHSHGGMACRSPRSCWVCARIIRIWRHASTGAAVARRTQAPAEARVARALDTPGFECEPHRARTHRVLHAARRADAWSSKRAHTSSPRQEAPAFGGRCRDRSRSTWIALRRSCRIHHVPAVGCALTMVSATRLRRSTLLRAAVASRCDTRGGGATRTDLGSPAGSARTAAGRRMVVEVDRDQRRC